MSRKSLIICLAVLASMILGIGIAVALLYSGGDDKVRKGSVVPDEDRYLLLPAVPADAVLVACLSDLEDSLSAVFPDFPVTSSRMAVSVHYTGALQTLYVFDTGKASAEPSADASALLAFADENDWCSEYVDCSRVTDGSRDIARRSVVLLSESETLVKSSRRHLETSVSIMDAVGFVQASSAADGSDVLFFSNSHSKVMMSELFSRKYASKHPFVAAMAQWTVADLTKADASGLYMSVNPVLGNDPSEYLTALSKAAAGPSKVSQILPSYTISAVTFPFKEMEPYMSAYQAFLDSKHSLQDYRKAQKKCETRAGISPEDFFRRLDVREVAKASFMTGAKVEEVNLLRIGREDTLMFIGTDHKSFKEYEPAIHSWPYNGFVSSVFGRYFELEDEKCFTYIDGWIVSGSLKAVEEYVSGRALDYTLVEYMADAGQKDMLSSSNSAMTVYYSFSEYRNGHKNVFRQPLDDVMKPFHEDCDYCPMIISAVNGRDGFRLSVKMPKLTMMKTKAPEFARDTTVVVPQGPFMVKNSGTGQLNKFYQNAHGSLCLQDESGKGLWGVPFEGKLCGRAYNVDYYANGKLQIIFGSGSKIYLIDRLSRFVSGFPVELGKDILLGPDVYDFNNSNAYNVMVLHKDNTVEMYNLKGRKPSSWKTVTAPETIKNLPERIVVGGNSFWVVRTAIQTLIYPFNGGEALTTFKGDEKIRPDSEIEILDGASVSVDCYDGKSRTVKLK